MFRTTSEILNTFRHLDCQIQYRELYLVDLATKCRISFSSVLASRLFCTVDSHDCIFGIESDDLKVSYSEVLSFFTKNFRALKVDEFDLGVKNFQVFISVIVCPKTYEHFQNSEINLDVFDLGIKTFDILKTLRLRLKSLRELHFRIVFQICHLECFLTIQ